MSGGYNNDDPSNAAVVADLAMTAVDPFHLDPERRLVSIVVPQNAEQVTLDLAQYGARPLTKTGGYQFSTAESFARYVIAHNQGERTALYADLPLRTVVAVLDDHEANTDEAGWGRHRAAYAPALSEEWQHWTGRDNRMMRQADFAEHILDGLPEIVEPDGSDMLELAHNLEVTSSATVKGRVMRSGGSAVLSYDEGQSSQSTVAVPERFTLGVKPFVECPDGYRLEAMFKFKASTDGVLMGYRLIRPNAVRSAAFDDVLMVVQDQCGVEPYLGVPPAAR